MKPIVVRDVCHADVLTALSPLVRMQLERFISAQERVNHARLHPRLDSEREHQLLLFLFGNFLFSRDTRVADLASAEVQEAIAIKEHLFPLGRPKLMLCVDGRVLAKLFAGLHGSALRTPAGDSKEILPRRKDGTPVLSQNSQLAQIIFQHLSEENANVLVEVLDSHIGCAARAEEEADRHGHELPDKGLYDDVVRKKEMGRALAEAVKKRFGGAKHLLIIQTSFDPHSGFCTMGLEQHLHDPRILLHGFTEEILETLIKERKILSTKHFVEEPRWSALQKAFEKHFFHLDYGCDYRHSTLTFWRAMQSMAKAVLPLIEKEVRSVFSFLKGKEHEAEVRERALILLANAFTAYLHNKGKYQYAEHDESIIAVTFSEKGPFPVMSSFSVDPTNPAISSSIKFTADLIRANRKAARMSDAEQKAIRELYDDAGEYAAAPVPVVFFEVIMEPRNDIADIEKTDWSDIVDLPWMSMSDDEFAAYLESKVPNITQSTAHAINLLRKRAVDLYRPGRMATDSLLEGRIVALWVLGGPHRKTIALFPFAAAGYDIE